MNTFNLKYGQSQLALSQSKTLIGVRPQRSRESDARAAVAQALAGADWEAKGALGGFQLVAMNDAKVDADDALDKIRSSAAVVTGTHVFELPGNGGIYVPTGDVFIEFDPKATDADRQELIDRHALQIKEARGEDGMIVSVTPKSANPIKVAAALQGDSRVQIAEPDLASRAALKGLMPLRDELLSDQWHLRNVGFHRNRSVGFRKGADARVLDAWAESATFGQADVVVAVIDDGFDLAHPDFAPPGKVVHPWDFSRRSANPGPEAGDWHGTACAGVAVASVGGGGVVGAAPGCTLMPVRWGPDLSDSQVEAWFGYVARRGASVVSCSWGAANPNFPLSTRAYRAIDTCATEGRGGRGCVIVFAAGNEDSDVNDPAAGTVSGFAAHPGVIAVAACTSRDERSSYSNFGREISVCAPSNGAGGWGILTSDVTGIGPAGGFLGYAEGDYTHEFGGTSSACPLVAGVAALLLSVKPELTSAEVKDILQRTARKIGATSEYAEGHSTLYGYGCVNALDAVKAVLPTAQPSIASALRAKAAPHSSSSDRS